MVVEGVLEGEAGRPIEYQYLNQREASVSGMDGGASKTVILPLRIYV